MTSRTWLITGISSGFGRHLAGQLLARGDRVAGTIRKQGGVDDLKAAHGDRLWTALLDVTDVPAIKAVVGQAFAGLGTIDVVVSNAGYGLFDAIEEVSEAEARAQIETNVFGALWATQAAVRIMRPQRSGHIIQISSIGGVNASSQCRS